MPERQPNTRVIRPTEPLPFRMRAFFLPHSWHPSSSQTQALECLTQFAASQLARIIMHGMHNALRS